MPRDYYAEEIEGKIKPKRDYYAEEISRAPINILKKKVPFAGIRHLIGAPEYQRGERSLFGEIGERPGAAIRGGIQEKMMGGRFLEGYKNGALVPEEVPKFEDIGERIGKITERIIPKTKGLFEKQLKFAGAGADIGTEPLFWLLTLLGTKKGEPALTKAEKSRFMTTPRKMGIPEIMGKEYTMSRTEQAVNLLDDMRTSYGKEVGDAISKSKAIVNAQKISKDLPQLPKNVLTALDDPIYGIEKLPDGSYNPSIQNMQRIRQAFDDFMTGKAWEEATKMGQRQVKQAYGVVTQAMKDAEPTLAPVLNKYRLFMKMFRNVEKTLRDTRGVILEKKLRSAFKPGAERQYVKAWEQFAKSSDEAAQIMKDMLKYTGRQAFKRRFGQALKYAGLGGGGLYGLRYLTRGFGE